MNSTDKPGRDVTPAGRTAYRVLLADDDPEMRGLLAHALHHDGYMVDECRDGHHLVARLVSADPDYFDIIVTDIRMPGINGLDFLDHLHQFGDVPPVVLITAFGDEDTHARARLLGAAAVLDKPFEIADLLATVRVFAGDRPLGGRANRIGAALAGIPEPQPREGASS